MVVASAKSNTSWILHCKKCACGNLQNTRLIFANNRLFSLEVVFIPTEQNFFAKSVSNAHDTAKVSNLLFRANKTAEKNKKDIWSNLCVLFVNELTRFHFENEWVLHQMLESIWANVLEERMVQSYFLQDQTSLRTLTWAHIFKFTDQRSNLLVHVLNNLNIGISCLKHVLEIPPFWLAACCLW